MIIKSFIKKSAAILKFYHIIFKKTLFMRMCVENFNGLIVTCNLITLFNPSFVRFYQSPAVFI